MSTTTSSLSKRRSMKFGLVSDNVLSLCQDVNKTITSACASDLSLKPGDAATRLFKLRKRDRISRHLNLSSSSSRRHRTSSDASTRSRSSSVGSALNGEGGLNGSPSYRAPPFSPSLPSPVLLSPSPLGNGGNRGYFGQTPESAAFASPLAAAPLVTLRQPTLEQKREASGDTLNGSMAAASLEEAMTPLAEQTSTPEPVERGARDSPASTGYFETHPVPPLSASGRSHQRDSSISSVHSFASSRGSYLARHVDITEDDLDRAARCGRFKTRPSDLFLRILTGILYTIELDTLANLVAPSCIASTGVIPISIISVIPDIVRHHADVIVTAEKEVFLATNFWERSASSRVITDALRELSRRAGERKSKVVVKIMYDRGNIKQLIEPHQIVPPKDYSGNAVQIPLPEEVPNLEIEVCNYHKPALGTLHSKFLVVDRRIALINSNNIQDRCNLEMMVHLEGEIVHSFFEMALFTWHNALSPPLTSLTRQLQPAETEFRFGTDNPFVKCKDDMELAQLEATQTIRTQNFPNSMLQHQNSPVDAPRGMFEALLFPEGGLGKVFAVTKRLNTTLQPDTMPTFDGKDMSDFQPHIVHAPHEPVPIALMNRKPRGSLDYTDTNNPQDAAWLGGMRWAQKSIFIQTPTFNAPPAVEGILAAVRRGVEVTLYLDLGFNDMAEGLFFQGGTNETVVGRMYAALTDESRKRLHIHWYTGKDMARPINAARKQRNCHIKLLIIDDHIGMQGNANMDSQSWFHSQESNIMIDSHTICKEWRDAIESNQNTGRFGKLDADGIWRDPIDGSLLESNAMQGGAMGKLKGLRDTARRAMGAK